MTAGGEGDYGSFGVATEGNGGHLGRRGGWVWFSTYSNRGPLPCKTVTGWHLMDRMSDSSQENEKKSKKRKEKKKGEEIKRGQEAEAPPASMLRERSSDCSRLQPRAHTHTHTHTHTQTDTDKHTHSQKDTHTISQTHIKTHRHSEVLST